MAAVAPKAEVKMEVDAKVQQNPGGGGGGAPGAGGGGGNQRGGGGVRRRQRGGGPAGPGRGFFGGRGGGGGENRGDRRPFDGFDGPMNKRAKMGPMNPEKLRNISGPSADQFEPSKFEVKKFAANTRLYIGNISNEATEAEIKELFAMFGEIDELFLNREKNFAFLKLDYRTSAEKARAELDQTQVKNRPIKVRFAPAPVRVKVKNLSPMVSNELLETAFSVFGDVERALVFVDEKGKSIGEGFVEFTRKNNALAAHKFCTDKCYFLTSELRPVITEMGDMYEVDEGLLEANLNKREYGKDRELVYYKSREMGPRIAEPGSFEHEYGCKWKALVQEFKEKENALKEEMKLAAEKLQTQMEMVRYDYETEMLRQQLVQREERQKLQWEQRGGFGGNPGFNNGMVGGNPMAEINQVDVENGGGENRQNPGALAPPPMPPQGLMQHLQGGDDDMNSGDPGPTWEIGPFGFNNQMSGNFGQPPAMRQNDQRDGRFMGPGGPPRGGMGPRGGGPRGGGGRGFRGGGRAGRR